MSDDKTKYTDLIRQLIPINELPQDIQNQVINSASLIKVKKNGFVFKQGERDNFSYYLLDGEIEMHANGQVHNSIVGGTDRARYAMAQLQPRQFSGKAKVASTVMQVARDSLDRLLILHQEKSQDSGITDGDVVVAEMEVSELDDDENVDWMTRMLQSEIFSKMPTANIHQLFALLDPVSFNKGDVVIRQGEAGEDYYIIQEGRCEVTRKPSADGKDVKLAELRAGDSFGEEALLAETNRNATITMVTDGVLMRLSKENFINLIKNPTLDSIPFEEARLKVESGAAKWLDVRFKNEHEKSAIEPSENIPLNILRMEMDKLDRATNYIVYCDTGGRSSTAAFLLAGRGFDVSFLKGGLVNSPGAADPSEVTNVPKPEQAVPPSGGDKKPKAAPARKKEKVETGTDDEKLDPGIKASVLDVEITQTNMKLEEVNKRQQEGMNEPETQAHIKAQKKLEAERAKLEAAKQAAEEEVRKLRQQEEEKLKRMQAEAEKRMQDEKKKLEEIYSRNAEEVEKLERLNQEAEEKARQERERIAKQEEAAQMNRGEAERIKKELEESRRALEEQARKQKLEQEEMAKKIQGIARKKLDEERKKMAQEYARNNEELEKAKRERAAAEAARVAAKKEAEKVISEYKAQHDRVRAEEEERLKAERLKLEEEQRKIQETLQEIQKARDEAEAIKQAAAAEVNTLKEKQKQEGVTNDETVQSSLKEELKQAEAKLNKAKLSIAQTQQQTVKIQQAKRVNAAELAKQTAEEEELRKQLAADLESFKEELDEQEKEYANAKTQMEHMRRIKERAAEAKKAAEDADSDLLSDIAGQLGGAD